MSKGDHKFEYIETWRCVDDDSRRYSIRKDNLYGNYWASGAYDDGSQIRGQEREWFPSYRTARDYLRCRGKMQKVTCAALKEARDQ